MAVIGLTLALLSLILPLPAFAQTLPIQEYRPIFRPVREGSGTVLVAIRSFRRGPVPHFLLVNPVTMTTSVVTAADVTELPAGKAAVAATPYLHALERFTAPPFRLQNQGAVRADIAAPGMFLTVDMCPSIRPFEREMFEAVSALSGGKAPVPVAIAITGRWLEHHGEEFAWLLEKVRAGRLSVTWVNHSFSHPYDPREPLERNFLLTPGTGMEREVLRVEVMLLERGVLPSPFFRFPGLVSDGRVVEELRRLSLIPIGSDAWLAKGERPRNGSFILVHGNGNEPPGIGKLLALLRGPEPPRFLPLPLAFAGP